MNKWQDFDQKLAQMESRLGLLRQTRPAGADASGATVQDVAMEDLAVSLEELHVMQEELSNHQHLLEQAHSGIEEERRRYRDLFQFSPDPYVVTDEESVIIDANEAVARLLGSTPDFLIGKRIIVFVARDARDTFREFLRYAGGRIDICECELRLAPTGASEERLCAVRAQRASLEGGGLRWCLRDVTEQRAQQRELDALRLGLERRVEERTAELNTAIEELRVEVEERKAMERHQHLLMGELNHRVKNTLANVAGISSATLRTAPGPSEFQERFEKRLAALSRAHALLSRVNWTAAGVEELLRQSLEPHLAADEGRLSVKGPPVRIAPKAALYLALAFHELGTNAQKYGALKVPEGRIRVEWSRFDRHGETWLRLRWTEEGGPPVSEPVSRGFGMKLITGAVGYELGGEASCEFPRDGVRCCVSMPLEVD